MPGCAVRWSYRRDYQTYYLTFCQHLLYIHLIKTKIQPVYRHAGIYKFLSKTYCPCHRNSLHKTMKMMVRTILYIFVYIVSFGQIMSNMTMVDSSNVSLTNTIPVTVPCSVKLSHKNISYELDTSKVSVIFSNQNNVHQKRHFRWVIAKKHTMRLLLLTSEEQNAFLNVIFSSTLGTLKVFISDDLTGCSSNLTDSEYIHEVQRLLLNLEDRASKPIRNQDERLLVCNNGTRNTNNFAVFELTCCYKDSHGVIVCENVSKDIWMSLVDVVILAVKVLALLLSVYLIPSSLYRKRHTYKEFVFSLMAPLEIEITKRYTAPPNVQRVKNIEIGTRHASCGYYKVLKSDHRLDKLSNVIETMEMSKTETFKLRAIWFKVDMDRLITRDNAPVGFLSFLYRRLFQCKCYNHGRKEKVLYNHSEIDENEHVTLHSCCRTRIARDTTWEKLVRRLVHFFSILLFFFVPLIFIKYYWSFEGSLLDQRIRTFSTGGYNPQMPFVSFKFIRFFHVSGLYFLYTFCIILWFLPLPLFLMMKCLKCKFFEQRTVRIFLDSYLDMLDSSEVGFSWAVSFFLRSFTSRTLTDVNTVYLLFSLAWKFVLLTITIFVLLFHKLPALNLLLRLLWSFSLEMCGCVFLGQSDDRHSDIEGLVQEQQRSSFNDNLKSFLNLPNNNRLRNSAPSFGFPATVPDRVMWFFICVCWFLCVLGSVPIIVDVVFVSVELLSAVTLCVLLNLELFGQYLVISILIIWYMKRSFHAVEETFQKYNNEIQRFLLERYTDGLFGSWVEDDAMSKINRAFQAVPVRGCGQCAACHTLSTKRGVPSWKARHLVQFIDEDGNPHIPKNFFFQSCYINHFMSPGSISEHFLNAGIRSFWLCFYMLVVFLLTNIIDLNLSIWGHLILLSALGLVPYVLRRSFTSDPSCNTIDISDEYFKQKLDHVIREFNQEWPVIDLEISRNKEDSITPTLEGNEDLYNESKCWFKTGNNICVCINLPNRKVMLDDTTQAESVVSTPSGKKPLRNGIMYLPRRPKTLAVGSPKHPSFRQSKNVRDSPLTTGQGGTNGLHTTPSQSERSFPGSESPGGRSFKILATPQKSPKTDGITPGSSELRHLDLPRLPTAACCGSKDDTLSVSSTLSDRIGDLHHQETIFSILSNMKSLNTEDNDGYP